MPKVQENKKSITTSFTGRKDVVVTEQGAIIQDVQILQEGYDKVGDYFDKDFLSNYVEMANAKSNGVKCRLGHPSWDGKDQLPNFLGNIKNHRTIEKEGKSVVIADVHISPVAKISPNGNNFDFIVEMAKNHPDDFGLSIHYLFAFKELLATAEDGTQGTILGYDLKDIIGCDFVDTPAVNMGLFKSINDEENLLNIIKQKGMNFLDKIKAKFGEGKKSIELTDASGAKITVETDNETPAVGDAVTIDGQPAADGEYIMSDESTIVVKDGVISEIKPNGDSADTEGAESRNNPTPEAQQKSINDMKKAYDAKFKSLEVKHAKEIGELKKTVEWLADQVSSGYVPDEAEQQGAGAENKKPKTKTNRTGFKSMETNKK